MEVKINREIKDYNETIFFGLSVRQFLFALLACGAAVGVYFGCRSFFGDGGSVLALYAGGSAVCGVRVRPLSGHDGGKTDCRMDSLGGSDATETSVPWRPQKAGGRSLKMGLFKTKQTIEPDVVPTTVEEAIPVQDFYEDGIALVGRGLWSKTFRFSDINYATASRERKEELFLGYSAILNSFDAGAMTKITVCNRRQSQSRFEKTKPAPAPWRLPGPLPR